MITFSTHNYSLYLHIGIYSTLSQLISISIQLHRLNQIQLYSVVRCYDDEVFLFCFVFIFKINIKTKTKKYK